MQRSLEDPTMRCWTEVTLLRPTSLPLKMRSWHDHVQCLAWFFLAPSRLNEPKLQCTKNEVKKPTLLKLPMESGSSLNILTVPSVLECNLPRGQHLLAHGIERFRPTHLYLPWGTALLKIESANILRDSVSIEHC